MSATMEAKAVKPKTGSATARVEGGKIIVEITPGSLVASSTGKTWHVYTGNPPLKASGLLDGQEVTVGVNFAYVKGGN